MNKKNIGAALSLVAAVTAGATAYASTVNNLDNDKNTNSMISPTYTDTNDYISFVEADYTNDLKNTAIAKEKRVHKKTKDDEERIAKIEDKANKIVAENLLLLEEKTTYEKEDSLDEQSDETALVPSEEEVSNAEISNDEVLESNEEPSKTSEESDDNQLVKYEDTNLDEAIEDINQEDLVENEAEDIAPQVNYLENNEENSANNDDNKKTDESEKETNEVGTDNKEINESEETDDFAVDRQANNQPEESSPEIINELVKYINTRALNVRSSKSIENSSNIVKTLKAGDRINGTVDGDWFKTNDGYVKIAYLSDSYPQTLIDSLNNEKVEKEETTKSKNESKEATPAVEKNTNQTNEVEEVKEDKNKVTEEVKGQAFTGWVYNTNVLNVRDKALNGKIVGTLNKGSKVSGEIANGWLKFDYYGKTSYVSSNYLTTEEVKEEKEVVEENKSTEQVKDEQELAVEKANKPIANNNGISAANVAGQFVGYPYVWGSSNPSVGFDCSGLVVNTYRQLGVSLPHSSAAQFNTGYAVDYNSLQPGDLIFFAIKGGGIDHVGIITSSDGTFIHACTPASGVRYDNVYNGYYQNSFRGARRIF